MTEGTEREPHQRRYRDPRGQLAIVEVDDHGLVQVSEELLNTLFIAIGMTEETNA